MNNPTSVQAHPPAPSFDLTGKRVVVVGGKKGIGLGVAQAAHSVGAAVTVASRRTVSAEEQPDLVAFDQVVLDIRDEAAVQAAFEAIGPFDHLVVTAGPEMGSWGSFMDPDMRGVRRLPGKQVSGYLGLRPPCRPASAARRLHDAAYRRHRGAG